MFHLGRAVFFNEQLYIKPFFCAFIKFAIAFFGACNRAK